MLTLLKTEKNYIRHYGSSNFFIFVFFALLVYFLYFLNSEYQIFNGQAESGRRKNMEKRKIKMNEKKADIATQKTKGEIPKEMKTGYEVVRYYTKDLPPSQESNIPKNEGTI